MSHPAESRWAPRSSSRPAIATRQGTLASNGSDSPVRTPSRVPPALPPKDRAGPKYNSILAAIESIQTASSNDGHDEPEVPRKRRTGWKPWPLHPLFLGLLAAVSVGMFVALQLLWNLNQQQGGIMFAPALDSFTTTQIFLYSYLPTIISVALGLAWSCVDLQAKRVEPWLQLSKKKPAPADESLLLSYPTDFALWIPFRAAAKRHWVTLFASLTALLVSLAVTPSIGAVFKTTIISTLGSGTARLAGLPTLTDQDHLLHGANIAQSITTTARAFAITNATFPAFSTPEYALTPFVVDRPVRNDDGTAQIIANTTKWYVDVDCIYGRANLTTYMHRKYTTGDYEIVDYTDDRGCAITIPLTNGIPDERVWTEITTVPCCASPTRNNYTVEDSCPPKKRWLVQNNDPRMFSGSNAQPVHFCSMNIFMQNVTARVLASNYSVIDTTAIGPRLVVPYNNYIDADMLQNIISTRIGKLLRNDTLTVTEAYQNALRAYYISAFTTFWTQPSGSSPLIPILVHGNRAAVVMDRTFTIIAQVTLMVGAVLTLGLLLAGVLLRSQLEEDPSSITRIAKFLRTNRLRHLLVDASREQKRPFIRLLKRYDVFMYAPGKGERPVLEAQLGASTDQNRLKDKDDRTFAQPPEFSTISGVALQIFLLAAIVAFTALLSLGASDMGLPWTIANPFVQRLLLSYIPTLFATAIDATFILIARTAAVLKPFEDLHHGPTPASQSVRLHYFAMIPQFMCLTAISMKHFTIFLLGVTSILALVLPVGISSLFVVVPSDISAQVWVHGSPNATFVPIKTTHFDVSRNILAKNHLSSYLSNRSDLAPWTTESNFFVPFDLADAKAAHEDASALTASTRGFDVQTRCRPTAISAPCLAYVVMPDDVNLFAAHWDGKNCGRFSVANFTLALTDGTTAPIGIGQWTDNSDPPEAFSGIANYFASPYRTVSWNYDYYYLSPGSNMRNYTGADQGDFFKRATYQLPKLQMQMVGTSAALNQSLGDTPAPPFLFSGYMRNNLLGPDHGLSERGPKQWAPYNSSGAYITCHADLRTAMFDVTVHPRTNVVISARRVGSWHPADSFFEGHTAEKKDWLNLALNDLDSIAGLQWGESMLPTYWLNRFAILLMRNNSFLDPAVDVVDVEPIAPALERVLQMWIATRVAFNGPWWSSVSSSMHKRQTSTDAQSGTISHTEQRVKYGKGMFELVVIILVWDLIIATWVYWRPRRTRRYLPRLPDSIGAVLSLLAASSALRAVAYEPRKKSFWTQQRDKGLDQGPDDRDVMLAYGKFKGDDGLDYLGIERVDRVTHLNRAETLEKKTDQGDGQDRGDEQRQRRNRWAPWS